MPVFCNRHLRPFIYLENTMSELHLTTIFCERITWPLFIFTT